MAFKQKKNNRFAALVTLALDGQEQPDNGECLSDSAFAALMDGRTTSEERSRLLAHIDGCDACFRIWVDTNQPVFPRKSAWRRYFPGMAVAASVCLLMVLFHIWQSPDIRHSPERSTSPESLVDNGLKFLQQKYPGQGASLSQLPWEREKAGYGFAPSPSNAMENRAFGAGLWMGKQALSSSPAPAELPLFLKLSSKAEPITWSGTRFAPYYELGRWCSLVKAALLISQPLPEQFWKGQNQALEKMLGKISSEISRPGKAKNNVLAARLETISLQLKNIPNFSPKSSHRKKLAAEIDILTTLLSPDKPSGNGL